MGKIQEMFKLRMVLGLMTPEKRAREREGSLNRLITASQKGERRESIAMEGRIEKLVSLQKNVPPRGEKLGTSEPEGNNIGRKSTAV